MCFVRDLGVFLWVMHTVTKVVGVFVRFSCAASARSLFPAYAPLRVSSNTVELMGTEDACGYGGRRLVPASPHLQGHAKLSYAVRTWRHKAPARPWRQSLSPILWQAPFPERMWSGLGLLLQSKRSKSPTPIWVVLSFNMMWRRTIRYS
jgi:hypothetical protein